MRTERAVELNRSGTAVAVDCGCGSGRDIEYLQQAGYQVYGFDINVDSIAICRERFRHKPLVEVSEASFETFSYPRSGVIIANNSLFFAAPETFDITWSHIKASIQQGGIFAGDFMGVKDSWANRYRLPTLPMLEPEVRALFSGFEILDFAVRDEVAETALGKMKHWNTYSVIARKCEEPELGKSEQAC